MEPFYIIFIAVVKIDLLTYVCRWFERSDAARAVVEGFKSEGLKIPPATAIAHQLIKSWVKMSSNL